MANTKIDVLRNLVKQIVKEEISLNEALNKDIKEFGKNLDDKLKMAGFDTLILMRPPSSDQLNTVKTNQKAAIFEVFQTQDTQTLTLYVNPSAVKKAESVINKFQLSDYNGPVLKRNWTAKQVQGAINPGDIVKQDVDKNKGVWFFYRLKNVGTKTVTV